MPIYARKKEGEYSVAPAGLHAAVCVDVVDLGLKDFGFGPQEKIQIRWQLEETDERGRRYMVVGTYTPSLHEKSKLRPLLESWRGKKFSEDELKQFDIERLLGANCQLSITHNMKDGGTYANVAAIVPPARNAKKLAPLDYMRMINRPDYVPPDRPEPEPDDEFDPTEAYEDSPF